MKMKRKLIGILLSVIMVIGLLAGCSTDGDSPETPDEGTTNEGTTNDAGDGEETSSGEKHKVYVITMDQMDQHWVNLDKGAQEAVEELGNVDYTWLAPDVKDDAKQIESINNAIAGGAEAIVLAANGPDAVTATLEEAISEGVKIVYIDSPANIDAEATFSTDNKAAGVTAGEELKAALEAKDVTSGDIGVINTNAASTSTVLREEGFRSVFEGTDFNVLETQYGEGDAAKSKDIAANYITAGCVGIFGTNEGSSTGVGNAIQEAGDSEVLGIGFDKSDTLLQLIKDGYLIASMAQNPDVMGYEGVKAAVAVLEGEDLGGAVTDTGVSVITAENVDEFQ
jgi:ribose transport system substrate-binding protein